MALGDDAKKNKKQQNQKRMKRILREIIHSYKRATAVRVSE